ncbi:MAG: hypothetical protein SPK00_07685 [Corynebacterium glucuronolyticum]|nr:hypothetical protein [Corynebacterium glucuronolyticum]MDD7587192.1 hypothetical protein [Mycobacteriaceae bacterium]MDY5834612.1 hypothetical protein [Corynebacterium glucuronolyticum]
MVRLSWVDHTGVETSLYPLKGDVYLQGDTLEGFTGVWSDNPTQVIGEEGARVDPRNRVIEPMTGALTLAIRSRDAYRKVRRMFSESKPGWLVLDRWRLCCRLAEGLPAPGVIPQRGATVRVSLIGDAGVWVQRFSSTGNVTVTNHGDVPVWPRIMWKGAGGPVVMPSGASFILPAVSENRVVDLRRSAGGRVTIPDTGVVDRPLSKQTLVISEMVPPGLRARFTVPVGATLSYEVGVLDVFAEVDSWI